MILVHMSVLIGFLKGSKTSQRRSSEISCSIRCPFGITPLIYQEVLQGAKTEKEYKLIKDYEVLGDVVSLRFY